MAYDPIIIAIKNRRIEKGMTQEQLAHEANMTTKTYQRIEQCASDMKISQYRQIVNALGMTDLDVSLDVIGIQTTTAWDVAAAARVLLPSTRMHLVQTIMSEWQRTEKMLEAKIDVKTPDL